MTAVLSTVGALFSYSGGATQNEAMLMKNAAAIKKTEAANQWNYYQAKSNKQNLAELALSLTPDAAGKDKYQKEIERYRAEKADIKAGAEKLEAESKAFEQKSDDAMHLHHRWAQFEKRKKNNNVAVVAIAREMAGWCWSLAMTE